jgi:hypothetical protein
MSPDIRAIEPATAAFVVKMVALKTIIGSEKIFLYPPFLKPRALGMK